MSRRLRTTAAHRRSFDRAPRVRVGELVQRIRDDEKNPGWFFGAAPDGVEGYFPSRWFDIDGARASALRDYDAMELTIEANVEVECLAEEAKWLLVRSEDGKEGWIPDACVS